MGGHSFPLLSKGVCVWGGGGGGGGYDCEEVIFSRFRYNATLKGS